MEKLISQSYELVYYDESSSFDGRTHFKDDEGKELTKKQRIEYLQHYASLTKKFHSLGEDFLASTVVSDDECTKVKDAIKEKPKPEVRKVIPLKYWRWKLGEEGSDEEWDWVKPNYDDSVWNELLTPTVMDKNRALLLRAKVLCCEFERCVLDIESIIDDYQIWVNGKLAYRHQGYEPVQFELTDFLKRNESNCLAVRVNKKEGEQIGIAGDVSLIITKKVFVDDLFVKTLEVMDSEKAKIHIELSLSNASALDVSGVLRVTFNEWFPDEKDSPSFSTEIDIAIKAGETKIFLKDVELKNIKLWTPDSPNLYKVSVVLFPKDGQPLDDYIEICGIKTIKQKGGKLYFNGQEFFMKSFGNDMGFAPAVDFHGAICPPDEWIVRDILLCKKANANTMRIHPWGFTGVKGKYNEYGWPEWGYPCDATNYERFLHIADQLGLCLIWGTRHWTLWSGERGGFLQNIKEEEMERLLAPSLKRVRNHPSIIVYEGLNEVGLRDETAWFYTKYIEIVNSIDDSRLVCPDSPWGPHFRGKAILDENIFHTENVFWDIHDYIGWYRDFKGMYDYAESYWPKGKERPMLLTECGAEAMPNWELYRGLHWHPIWLNNGRPSSEIEKARIGRPLRQLKDSEANLSQAYQGLCIQQTVNYLRTTGADGVNINLIADGLAEGNYHKGVCDLYRKAKLGYYIAMMVYKVTLVTGMDGDFVFSSKDELKLKVVNDNPNIKGKNIKLELKVFNMDGETVDALTKFGGLEDGKVTSLGQYKPKFKERGFYQIEYALYTG